MAEIEPASSRSPRPASRRSSDIGGDRHGDMLDGRPLSHLRFGLRRGGRARAPRARDRGVRSLADAGGCGPFGGVHARRMPPAPALLRREGQEGSEQPLKRVEGDGERRFRGCGGCVAAASVGASLHQLHVVIGEPPEERLGALEGAGVIEGREGRRRLGDDRVETGDHRAVDRIGRPRRRSPHRLRCRGRTSKR